MRLTHLDAENPAWYELRRDRVTASVAGGLCGYSKFKKSRKACWMSFRDNKHRNVPPTPAMVYGIYNEPVALEWFVSHMGLQDAEVDTSSIFLSDKYQWLAATPDAYVELEGERFVVEIKCPLSQSWEDHYDAPTDYLIQLLVQMHCADVPFGYLVWMKTPPEILAGATPIFRVVKVFYDEELFDELVCQHLHPAYHFKHDPNVPYVEHRISKDTHSHYVRRRMSATRVA
jgi:putative phage-type endonuclease